MDRRPDDESMRLHLISGISVGVALGAGIAAGVAISLDLSELRDGGGD